jgi:hypothetical protein
MFTSDDIDLQSTLESMNSNDIILIECHTTSSYIEYWNYWTGITGGSVFITDSSTLVDDVVNEIVQGLTFPIIYDLHLEIMTPGYSEWLYSVNPVSYPEVDPGAIVTFEETICVPLDATPGLHTFIVSAIDEDEISYGDQTNEITVVVNAPPNTPSNPDPNNNEIDVSINADLSWTGGDPDPGDTVTYDVYFGTSNPPPQVSWNQTSTSYDSDTLVYNTVYYWQIIAWDFQGEKTVGPLWSFTTKEKSSSPPPPPPDTDPTADAGGPYYGFVGEEIEFDGTNSKDNDDNGASIQQYDWKFFSGDSWHEDLGATPTQIYEAEGEYTVTLRVTDDEEATDTDTAVVYISSANNPPSQPSVEGPLFGHQETSLYFDVVSIDVDNDSIRYVFDWGDNTSTTTTFYANGTMVTLNHSWLIYGEYMISVFAEDNNNAISSLATYTIFIDVQVIDDQITGYLIDFDSDDVWDVFQNDTSGNQTDVEEQDGSFYLIDGDGNSRWDYVYNHEIGVSTYLDFLIQKYYIIFQTELATPGFEVVSLLIAIGFVFIISRKRKQGT